MESLASIVDFCSGFYSQKALMRRVEAESQTKIQVMWLYCSLTDTILIVYHLHITYT